MGKLKANRQNNLDQLIISFPNNLEFEMTPLQFQLGNGKRKVNTDISECQEDNNTIRKHQLGHSTNHIILSETLKENQYLRLKIEKLVGRNTYLENQYTKKNEMEIIMERKINENRELKSKVIEQDKRLKERESFTPEFSRIFNENVMLLRETADKLWNDNLQKESQINQILKEKSALEQSNKLLENKVGTYGKTIERGRKILKNLRKQRMNLKNCRSK